MAKKASSRLEWRINVPDGTSKVLEPESGAVGKIWVGLKGCMGIIVLKVWRVLENAWHIGVADPRKVIHCIKVGLALSIVSLFYYMRPLYDDFGGNAMWAVMTVVVVFEYTVGATFYKCINRVIATFLAGALGVGIHLVAEQSGDQLKPIILGISVFLFASAATFSRFIPSVKARFDYGAMIFILTFSLVSVSGYRVVELFELAHLRLSTIAIGTSLCILVTMLFCPVWAGCELHHLIHQNMEKLADSLDGCVTEYFKENGSEKDLNKKMQGYKCVLNSKAAEESMANFARWEPTHGRFNFRHPWKQYLKIGASLRNCAYCIETLNSCISSEIQAPPCLRKHFSNKCMKASSYSINVLKELVITIVKMKKSSNIDVKVAEMNFAVEELVDALKSLPTTHFIATTTGEESTKAKAEGVEGSEHPSPIMKVLPLVKVVSLMVEIATRIGGVVNAVEELARLAEFKAAKDGKPKQNQPTDKLVADH
ncbi:hypothetical protein Golax_016619 [Gossypium laxum]|uniref:Aluminum-activated malate transporter 10-like n=1 Tax=Gossypium laxum TaxID=34288 RepID=A0A7J8YXR9_9ROSI|nr:hypothetical protein [Gossypium laxum]